MKDCLKNNYLKLILIFTFIGFIPDIVNNLFEYFFNISIPIENESVNKMSYTKIIIYTVIIGPILETFIFQTVFFRGAFNFIFFRKNPKAVIFISAFFFSLVHYYSLEYIFFAFYGGLILAIFYLIIYNKTKSHKKSSLMTVIIHSLRNLIIFFIVNVFEIS